VTDAELLAVLVAERDTTAWWWTGTRAADVALAPKRRDRLHRAAHPHCFPGRRTLAEEVEWLIDTGCGWGEILRRLNMPADAVARRLNRWGRPDLARHFDHLERSAAA